MDLKETFFSCYDLRVDDRYKLYRFTFEPKKFLYMCLKQDLITSEEVYKIVSSSLECNLRQIVVDNKFVQEDVLGIYIIMNDLIILSYQDFLNLTKETLNRKLYHHIFQQVISCRLIYNDNTQLKQYEWILDHQKFMYLYLKYQFEIKTKWFEYNILSPQYIDFTDDSFYNELVNQIQSK